MKITIITLYVEESCEHYVGAVQGSLDLASRRSVAKGHNAVLAQDAGEDEPRQIFFRETWLDAAQPGSLLNMSDDDDL